MRSIVYIGAVKYIQLHLNLARSGPFSLRGRPVGRVGDTNPCRFAPIWHVETPNLRGRSDPGVLAAEQVL